MKHRIIIFFIAISLYSKGQNISQYSLSPFDKVIYNPAQTGIGEGNIFFHHRSQFVGLTPINFSNQALMFDMPLYKINSGIGINLRNDFSGFLSITNAEANYAYHLKLKRGKLSMGLSLGVEYNSLNNSKLTVASGDYSSIVVHNDKLLDNTASSSLTFNSSIGIYYSINKLELGLSVKNLLEPKTNLFLNGTFQNNRVFLSSASYQLKLSEHIKYRPYVLYKTDLIKHQLELSNIFDINENISTGFALRGYNGNNLDAVGIFFGMAVIKKLWIYYNYDIPVGTLKGANYGSHEILVNYKLNIKNKQIKRYFSNYNSRYL